MINWRTILRAPAPTQFTHNTQKSSSRLYCEDIAEFAYRAVHSGTPVQAPHVSASNPGMAVPSSLPPDPPTSPLPPHCFVTYTDSQGRLCGGWDDRNTCTVMQYHGVGADSPVELSNGSLISLQAVRAVGKLNAEGRLIGAWAVREHGYDGNEPTMIRQERKFGIGMSDEDNLNTVRPGGRIGEAAKFENASSLETIGFDLLLSFRSQSLTEDQEAGGEPMKPHRAR